MHSLAPDNRRFISTPGRQRNDSASRRVTDSQRGWINVHDNDFDRATDRHVSAVLPPVTEVLHGVPPRRPPRQPQAPEARAHPRHQTGDPHEAGTAHGARRVEREHNGGREEADAEDVQEERRGHVRQTTRALRRRRVLR